MKPSKRVREEAADFCARLAHDRSQRAWSIRLMLEPVHTEDELGVSKPAFRLAMNLWRKIDRDLPSLPRHWQWVEAEARLREGEV